MNLTTIETLMGEIDYLRKKAKVLDLMLVYYDRETMTCDIQPQWAQGYLDKMNLEKKQSTPASPRHMIAKLLQENLPYGEIEHLINWDRLYETVASQENKKQSP